MSRVQVAILGYGVIGRRLADAVRQQPDMAAAGVAGRAESPSLYDALLRGHRIYAAAGDPAGVRQEVRAALQGSFAELAAQADVILDCTPSGVPGSYAHGDAAWRNTPVIVQGGEAHAFGGVSFNAFANFHEASGRRRVRVISCSSTGIARFLYVLDRAFGVEDATVHLVRRAADPGKASKTPIGALKPVMKESHHGPDVRTVLRHLRLYTTSLDTNTTLGHLLTVRADLLRPVRLEDVENALDRTPRIWLGEGRTSTAELAEHMADLGRSRQDRPEIFVFREALQISDRTVYAAFSVHMESITIPETVDCIRSVLRQEGDPWQSMRTTDAALGIAKSDDCYPPCYLGGSS